MRRSLLFFCFLLCFGFLLSSAALAGDVVCLLDGLGARSFGMVDCPTETGGFNTSTSKFDGGKTAIDTGWGGVRLNAGVTAKTPIDVFNLCRYVDNHSSEGYFVPFRTVGEWQSFIANYPSPQISVAPCAKPYAGIDMAHGLYFGRSFRNDNMGDTGDEYKPVDLPYWRAETPAPANGIYKETLSVQCYGDAASPYCWAWGTCCDPMGKNCSSCCTDSGSVCNRSNYSWSEVFGITLSALNSDGGVSPSWSGSSYRISGCRPSACDVRCQQAGHNCNCTVSNSTGSCSSTPPNNGACGTSNGTSSPTWPLNLCASGLVSNQVETATAYTWDCLDPNGGSSASCSATKGCSSMSLADYGACTKWSCFAFANNVAACLLLVVDYNNATSDLNAALASGDCVMAQAVVDAYQTHIDNYENSFCGPLMIQTNACTTSGGSLQNCMQAAAISTYNGLIAAGINISYVKP